MSTRSASADTADPAAARDLPPKSRALARVAKGTPAELEAVVAKILALADGASVPAPVLWRKSDLSRALLRTERPMFEAALARMEQRRECLRLADGGARSPRFLFAGALRRWLGPPADSPPPAPAAISDDPLAELPTAYARTVRESGGFPDVKISTLQRALPGVAAASLDERLRALWREGRVTLSLGDWSLASEEMRRAAIELAGERYLLVRFEDSTDEPLPD